MTISKSAGQSVPGRRTLLGEPSEIRARVALINAEGPAVLGLETIADRLHIDMQRDGRDVPVTVAVSVESRTLPGPLTPGDALTANIAIRTVDGSTFQAATYHLTVDLRDVLEILRTGSGERWTGRMKLEDRSQIDIKTIESPEDEATYNDLEGNARLGEGRPQEAIRYFERFAELRPDLWRAHASLGASYVRSNMYSSAIPRLEQAWTLWERYAAANHLAEPMSRQSILGPLARAYDAVGRSADANRVRERMRAIR